MAKDTVRLRWAEIAATGPWMAGASCAFPLSRFLSFRFSLVCSWCHCPPRYSAFFMCVCVCVAAACLSRCDLVGRSLLFAVPPSDARRTLAPDRWLFKADGVSMWNVLYAVASVLSHRDTHRDTHTARAVFSLFFSSLALFLSLPFFLSSVLCFSSASKHQAHTKHTHAHPLSTHPKHTRITHILFLSHAPTLPSPQVIVVSALQSPERAHAAGVAPHLLAQRTSARLSDTRPARPPAACVSTHPCLVSRDGRATTGPSKQLCHSSPTNERTESRAPVSP